MYTPACKASATRTAFAVISDGSPAFCATAIPQLLHTTRACITSQSVHRTFKRRFLRSLYHQKSQCKARWKRCFVWKIDLFTWNLRMLFYWEGSVLWFTKTASQILPPLKVQPPENRLFIVLDLYLVLVLFCFWALLTLAWLTSIHTWQSLASNAET